MTVDPPGLRRALEKALGCRVQGFELLRGGMINQAARVSTSRGDCFVKWKVDAPPGFFAAEADGLERLRRAGALRVPGILALQDSAAGALAGPATSSGQGDPSWVGESCGAPPFLALEFIREAPPRSPEGFARSLAEGLAELHRSAVSPRSCYGLEVDNFVGLIPQRNDPRQNWAAFYRDLRLLPQIDRARLAGLLPAERERGLMQVVERMDGLLGDAPGGRSLIHGDLWSGNFLCAAGEAVVIDPAVYYAGREIELAYVELFGGFPPGFMKFYDGAFPLEEGYARRRLLYQLYPLLNHLNHFGEEYGPMVDAACRPYLPGH